MFEGAFRAACPNTDIVPAPAFSGSTMSTTTAMEHMGGDASGFNQPFVWRLSLSGRSFAWQECMLP